jgi:KDO2-lipid IV(A) lauroyltransferase
MLTEERRCVNENLRRVLPNASPSDLDHAVADVFKNFACCFTDLLTVNRLPAEKALRYMEGVHGNEHLASALDGGCGLIVATAHLGNWELGGRLLAARWLRPTHVVLSAEEDPAVEALLRRDNDQVRFVTRAASTISLTLLAALRRNEIVAVQGDRATGGRADVNVPFFGAPAPFPLGPFLLARASGAPILPAFCVLGEDARYRVFIEPPIWVKPGAEEASLCQLVAVLQRYVSTYPHQWFNFYDVWSPVNG